MSEVKYYTSFDQDFAESKGQDFKLPENYIWIHKNPIYRIVAVVFFFFIYILATVYMKLFGHVSVKNRYVLLRTRGAGFFLYANHTQLFGDVVNPFNITFPIHPYPICSPANLGIPRIGKLLPMAGALPIPDTLDGMKKFTEAVSKRIKQHAAVVIYPEGHLWPYYTKIRPLALAAFHYPVTTKAPSFVATTTYKKRRFGKKPKVTIYLDGPFYPKADLKRKEAAKQLQYEIQKTMERRAKHSTYSYITYKKKSI